MNAQATALLKRLSQLKAERLPFENSWKQAYKYGCPERQQSFQDSTNSGLEQERKQARAELFDSTACESIQLLTSSIYSGTTNPTSKWFQALPSGLGSPIQLTEGEKWLEEVFHTKLAFDKDNQYQTSFNLGQGDVINFILARIKEAEIKL